MLPRDPDLHDGVRGRLDENQYRILQLALLLRPEEGPVIPGSGGSRKLRLSRPRAGGRVLGVVLRVEQHVQFVDKALAEVEDVGPSKLL